MSEQTHETARAVHDVVAAVQRLAERGRRVLAALDGPSGAGKSTLAARVAAEMGGAVVPADDFFAADIPAAAWDAMSPRERAEAALDWRRLRRDALDPMRAGRAARWYAFDFEAGPRPDGTYAVSATPTVRSPARVVVVDGAYSARPELADLVDLAVLVSAPPPVCRARLGAREEAALLAGWHARWAAAEAYYFTRVCPPERFNIVVTTAPHSPADRGAGTVTPVA